MNKYLHGVARIIGGAYPARGGQQRDRAAFHIVGISTARFSESRSDRSILAQRVTLARAIADSLIAISTRSPIPGYLHSHRRRLPVRARVGRPRVSLETGGLDYRGMRSETSAIFYLPVAEGARRDRGRGR
jgi:hypothetical protein